VTWQLVAFFGDRPTLIRVLCPGDFLGSQASLIRVTGHTGDGFLGFRHATFQANGQVFSVVVIKY
jgi:hypothetical protein